MKHDTCERCGGEYGECCQKLGELEARRCKTCRHWDGDMLSKGGDFRDIVANDTAVGPMRNLKQLMCGRVVQGLRDSMSVRGFHGFVFTGPDFGCIHHEPRE